MTDRSVRIVFRIEDAETNEAIIPPQQFTVRFVAAEFDRIEQAAREKLAVRPDSVETVEISDHDLKTLLCPMRFSWVGELIDAGFTTLRYAARSVLIEWLTKVGVLPDARL